MHLLQCLYSACATVLQPVRDIGRSHVI